jgi:hypothetical protein
MMTPEEQVRITVSLGHFFARQCDEIDEFEPADLVELARFMCAGTLVAIISFLAKCGDDAKPGDIVQGFCERVDEAVRQHFARPMNAREQELLASFGKRVEDSVKSSLGLLPSGTGIQ